VQLDRDPPNRRLPRLRGAADVYRDFASLARLDREAFVVLLLDQKNRVTGVHVVSVGSLNASLVHPREVFKTAILGNAAAVIVLHNHPSGDPTPSREDHEITHRLRLCGDTLGIPLLDHVVVAVDGYRSFAESGLM
jgi:DNA repair protein RadC